MGSDLESLASHTVNKSKVEPAQLAQEIASLGARWSVAGDDLQCKLGGPMSKAAQAAAQAGQGRADVGRREPRAMRVERARAVADDREAARRADGEVARCDRAGDREVGLRAAGRVRALGREHELVQNSACRGARGNGI